MRPLSPDDLRWWFREAESRLGVRSTFGAFVDLALSGIQGGGRSNGVERSWTERKHRAAARERCIRARLQGLESIYLATLAAAYGPHALAERAERLTGDRAARTSLRDVFGELLPVVLLLDDPALAPRPAAPSTPAVVRATVRCGGPGFLPVVRREEEHDEDGVVRITQRLEPGMHFESTLRRIGDYELLDAVETDASFMARVMRGDIDARRAEVHLRRWRGGTERPEAFVLGRLAAIASASLRAKERASTLGRGTPTREDAADLRDQKTAERLRSAAKGLLQAAKRAAGVVERERPPARRRSAQRTRPVVTDA